MSEEKGKVLWLGNRHKRDDNSPVVVLEYRGVLYVGLWGNNKKKDEEVKQRVGEFDERKWKELSHHRKYEYFPMNLEKGDIPEELYERLMLQYALEAL